MMLRIFPTSLGRFGVLDASGKIMGTRPCEQKILLVQKKTTKLEHRELCFSKDYEFPIVNRFKNIALAWPEI